MSNELIGKVFGGLLDSCVIESLAEECVDTFDDYDWSPKSEVDHSSYAELVSKAKASTIKEDELKQLMRMTEDTDCIHPYYWVVMAEDLHSQLS